MAEKLSSAQRLLIKALFLAGPEATVHRAAYFGPYAIENDEPRVATETVYALWRRGLLKEDDPLRRYRLSEAGCLEGQRLVGL